jgi:hypothetical protein
MKLRISNDEVKQMLAGETNIFPKYTTQLMNLANQNSQGTRARVVGQMSDLIQEFEGKTMVEWEKWYLMKHPDAIGRAAGKISAMVTLFKNAILEIDEKMIKDWVEDLVIIKTFAGLKFQEAILKKISKHYGMTYRLAEPNEESQGIDGYINNKPVSIKPITYKNKLGLNESIEVPIIFYDKKKNQIVIEFDQLEL